jgi:hypothetical protein
MKRYTTWFDETFWRKTAIESGLRFGVYDNHKEDKAYGLEEEFGIITSSERAKEVASILNGREENAKS